jgi:hypothetical protein
MSSNLLLIVLEAGYLKAGVLILVVNGGIRLAEALRGLATLHQRHDGADGDEHDENCPQCGTLKKYWAQRNSLREIFNHQFSVKQSP